MGIRLWKRKNGVYYVLWEENGKTRSKSLGTSDKAKARRELKAFQREAYAGKVKALDSGYTIQLEDFVDEFLHHAESKSKASYTLYKVALEKALKSWGNILLSRINSRMVDTLIADMIRDGLAVPTINKNIRQIKAALNQAYKWEYISKPVQFPKKIKEQENIRYLPIEDFRRLFEFITDPEFYDLCLLSAYSGMRSGEILRLKNSDIDNPEGFLRISPKQKSQKEDRIPITKAVREILTRAGNRKNNGKIFKYTCLSWISQKFKAYARTAGYEHIRFHDLRHSYASHLAMSGVDIYTIQKLMRHSSPTMTMHYAKLSPGYLAEHGEKLSYGPMAVPGGKEK